MQWIRLVIVEYDVFFNTEHVVWRIVLYELLKYWKP